MPKDDILLTEGESKSYDIYREVLRDAHCWAVLQKRWLAVVGREWEVVPASDRRIDKKAADMVRTQLEAIGSYQEEVEGKDYIPNLSSGFDQLCYGLLRGELYGFQPAEIIWDTDGKEVYAKQVKTKTPRRFIYTVGEKGYRFRLLTPDSPVEGIPLPPQKFIIHTVFNEDDNPYGWGLGYRLFYPVYYKRMLARFSLVYADKYGTPTGIGKYPSSQPSLKEEILEAMDRMAQQSGIAIPQGAEFSYVTPSGTGTDIYAALMDYYDREMSKAVLGETGSTDQQGTGGSRARDQVGNEVRIEIAKGSADLLGYTLRNSLSKWITQYNFGNRAEPPGIWRKFPELEEREDLNSRAQRDSTIATMMELKPTRRYIEETYGIELEEPKPEEDEGGGLASELGAIFGNTEQSAEEQTPEVQEFKEEPSFNPKQIISWNGLSIGLQYLPGDQRFGKVLKSGYGHIRGLMGADRKSLDVYLHKNAIAGNERYKTLYRITQLNKEGEFDEYKIMAGYSTKANAKKAYLEVAPNELFGEIRAINISELQQYRKGKIKDAAEEYSEQAIEAVLPEIDKWRRRINKEVQAVNRLPLNSEAKFAELQERLYSLYSELNEDKYTEVLGEAIAAAEVTGRWEIIKQED